MDQYRKHPAKACVWDGEQLVPAADASAAESVVWFVVPPDPAVPRDYSVWEALNATEVGDDIYRLGASPALFAHAAFGDRVNVVRSGEGALVVTSIAGRGGHTSARVWFEQEGDTWRIPVQHLARAGCVVDVYSERLVGISWPSALHDVLPSLERLEAEGVLVYATT